jgi:hypothetical protein
MLSMMQPNDEPMDAIGCTASGTLRPKYGRTDARPANEKQYISRLNKKLSQHLRLAG